MGHGGPVLQFFTRPRPGRNLVKYHFFSLFPLPQPFSACRPCNCGSGLYPKWLHWVLRIELHAKQIRSSYWHLSCPEYLASTSGERVWASNCASRIPAKPISYANYAGVIPDFRRPISIVNFYEVPPESRRIQIWPIIIPLRLALPHRYTFLGYYMMMMMVFISVLARVQMLYKESGWLVGWLAIECQMLCGLQWESLRDGYHEIGPLSWFKLPVEPHFNCFQTLEIAPCRPFC